MLESECGCVGAIPGQGGEPAEIPRSPVASPGAGPVLCRVGEGRLIMGRFEREENESGIEGRRLPPSLGVVTEDLRSTIESEVAKIVERAEARAAEIEDRALEKAGQVEHRSKHRAHEVFQGSRERVGRMLADLDAVERSVKEAVASLREEAEGLAGELDSARSESFEAVEPPVAAVVVEQQDDGALAEPAVTSEGEDSQGAEPDDDQYVTDFADEEVREMIRQQLFSLAASGRNRADAERMLLRFRQGEQYFDLLDEIYPEETGGRRGLLRRRKVT
jgi:hypothetical protein